MVITTHASGFTLFELIIYIALSVLSITLLSVAFSGIYTHVISAISCTNSSIQRYSALQCMAQDIAQAVQIIECAESTITIKKENTKKTSYICWSLKGTKLIRSVGLYNESESRWSHKISQTLATNIIDVDFTYKLDVIPCFLVRITLPDNNIAAYCMPRRLGIAL